MIRKHEKGLAFIPLLLIFSVGALLIPAFLNRLDTSLISSNKAQNESVGYYSAESAAEHAIWRLLYEEGFASSMDSQNPPTSYSLNVNDTDVVITITKLFADADSPEPLSTSEVFKVTKTVTPTTATPGFPETFTYTIQLQNQSQSPQNLQQLRDILPVGFFYAGGSSSGITTSEPQVNTGGSRDTLRWSFNPDIIFQPAEIKTQTFQVTATPSEGVYCSEAWAQPGASNSGPTAKIIVGNPANTACPDAVVNLTKTVDRDIVFLLEPTTFTYTIAIENVGSQTVNLTKVRDLLPPGNIIYVSGSSSGIATSDPSQRLVNGRWELTWGINPKIPLPPGEIMTQTFQADATLEVGQYCNEAWMILQGTSDSEIYSWPTACVTLYPAFDIEADAGDVIVRAHTLIFENGYTVRSWQIE